MSAARLGLHPDAANEYVDAARWYGERSATVHDSFVSEVERAFKLIVAFPNRWPRYGPRHRRVLVRRFPYSVVYLEKGGRLWVVAIAHAKRKPFYWAKRTIPRRRSDEHKRLVRQVVVHRFVLGMSLSDRSASRALRDTGRPQQ